MTKLLDKAIATVRELPPEMQDDVARMLLSLAGDEAPPIILSEAERAAIAVSKAAAVRGEFATEEQVRAMWAKHGL
ncbi:hypothetical protein V3H18_05380 [Methylocystis sp. 9N]|uniref:Addiction module antitoxin RelB n=1 Tax=Methylocystis borbori TaxID=3118750 RepID=A0ABU7XHF5_9HYPH